jgi:tetratricopeptide (TPR) repeat protein
MANNPSFIAFNRSQDCLLIRSDFRHCLPATLRAMNSQNHRAFQRKGELLAVSDSSQNQLEQARQALSVAIHLNSEETGTLVLLGEVSLAMRDLTTAEQDFAHACQTNARAANAWFFRGFIAWKRGDARQASADLRAARNVRGPD